MSQGYSAVSTPTKNKVTLGHETELATKKNSDLESEYVSAIRKASGVVLTQGGIVPQSRASSKLVGNAEAGVIEATRRISGMRAAIIESNTVEEEPMEQKNIPIMISGEYTDQEEFCSQPWHSMDHDEIFRILGSNLQGLSTEEHEKRAAFYGPNAITPPKTMHWFLKFCINLVGGFQLMLWFGAILCFIVYGLTHAEDVQTLALAIVLILVVLVTTIFQSYQEGKSDQVMAALKALSPSTVFVFRDGTLQNVSAESLVPGDVVKVRRSSFILSPPSLLPSLSPHSLFFLLFSRLLVVRRFLLMCVS
jgi:magnesium-transporting ATPase (P-type)